jgi:hypothetical protein
MVCPDSNTQKGPDSLSASPSGLFMSQYRKENGVLAPLSFLTGNPSSESSSAALRESVR